MLIIGETEPGSRRGKCRQVWMGDKKSRGPSSGGAYGMKWLSLRRLILPETGNP